MVVRYPKLHSGNSPQGRRHRDLVRRRRGDDFESGVPRYLAQQVRGDDVVSFRREARVTFRVAGHGDGRTRLR